GTSSGGAVLHLPLSRDRRLSARIQLSAAAALCLVPAIGSGPGARAAYLQRARFLAIAEFGPGSLIYHEGRAYRVHRAKLPPGVRAESGGKIATATLVVCDACGAGHQQQELERCHACGAGMGGTHP